MRKIKIFLVKGCIFIFLFFLLLFFINKLLMPKTGVHVDSLNYFHTPYYEPVRFDGFYELEKNSLDVIFLGASQVHCAVDPNIIWEKFGITSYDFTADGQSFAWSGYYLKEILKYQQPQIVVLDIGAIMLGEPTVKWQHWSSDFVKSSIEKYSYILKKIPDDEALELIVPLYRYHDRWKNIKEIDWKYFYSEKKDIFNGFLAYTSNTPFSPPPSELAKGITEEPLIKDKKRYYNDLLELEEMQRICDENKIKLIFIKTPIILNDERVNFINQFKKDSSLNGWKFIDFNISENKEMTLDFSKDFADEWHLNYWGAEKFSERLGIELLKVYQKNIKSEKLISSWEQKSKDVKKMYEIHNMQ